MDRRRATECSTIHNARASRTSWLNSPGCRAMPPIHTTIREYYIANDIIHFYCVKRDGCKSSTVNAPPNLRDDYSLKKTKTVSGWRIVAMLFYNVIQIIRIKYIIYLWQCNLKKTKLKLYFHFCFFTTLIVVSSVFSRRPLSHRFWLLNN